MTSRQPLTTENYEYKLDEEHRERLLRQVERDRLASLAQRSRPAWQFHLPDLNHAVRQLGHSIEHFAHWLHDIVRGHRVKGA
jgi:hypothetical protein